MAGAPQSATQNDAISWRGQPAYPEPVAEAADFIALTGGRNLFVLAAAPGEETLACGALIGEACARGRPPFVAILTDGALASQTRVAVACLGVPADWLLLLGLRPGAVATPGSVLDAVMRAVTMLMWRYDCDLIVAPGRATGSTDQRGCHAIAAGVAAGSGVGLLTYEMNGPGVA